MIDNNITKFYHLFNFSLFIRGKAGAEEKVGPSVCGVGGGVGGESEPAFLVRADRLWARLLCNSSSSSSRLLNISLLNRTEWN